MLIFEILQDSRADKNQVKPNAERWPELTQRKPQFIAFESDASGFNLTY